MPPRLREQLNTLIASINSAINQVDRSGSTSSSLADFQSGLRIIIHGIESTFNRYTRAQGIPFEDGDYTSNSALSTSLRTLRDSIEPSFRDFRDGRGGPRITETNRLNDLISQYKGIEVEVVDIMTELSFRLANGTSSISNSGSTTGPGPLSSISELRRALQAQRFTPTSSFLARNLDPSPSSSITSYSSTPLSDSRVREMREHMQNSWVEVERNGSVLWVNKWDPREETRTRPPHGAFILRLRGRAGGEEEDVDEMVERLARGWSQGWRDDGREYRERVRRWQALSPEEQMIRRAVRPAWMTRS